MAEGDTYKPNEDFVAWIIGLIIVVSLVSAAHNSLRDRFGIDIFNPRQSLKEKTELFLAGGNLNENTPLGVSIRNRMETDVWSEVALGRQLGIQREGAKGVLIGGPVFVDGRFWWDIDYQSDPDGWVRQEHIGINPLSPARLLLSLADVGKRFSVVLALLLLTGIVYSILRINQIRKRERELLGALPEDLGGVVQIKNERWEKVLEHVESTNPGDWRLAIIEADVMLDELMSKIGYHGETLGEKLKSVEKSDFNTLDAAWEAHKVRNRIAHHGSDFILTQREARRVVELFRDVFEEFRFV